MPAVAIPAIIGAAGSIGGGLIASHAAGKASEQEQQASNQALGLQGRIFDQQTAALQPFVGLGTSAAKNLRGLAGYGPDLTSPGTLPPPPNSAPTLAMLQQPGWSASMQTGQPGSQNYSQTWQGPGQNPLFQAGSPGAMRQSGAMVTLRAPDGSTKQVPADQAEHFLSLGAQRVG